MIKSSLDNYCKSSAECLAIGFCLYLAITFHNNSTKAKIAIELITPVQSLNIQLSRAFTGKNLRFQHWEKMGLLLVYCWDIIG